MDKTKANIKIGSQKLHISIPAERERAYRLVGQELDRLYYIYKSLYPQLSETELYTTIAFICALQKAGVNIKESPTTISYCRLRWQAFIASVKHFFRHE